MSEPLWLTLREPRRSPAYTCSVCGVRDSDGTRGPKRIAERGYGYELEAGPWLCARHSREVWGAYLVAVKRRRELIEASRALGWPATEAQARRWRERGGGVQLDLLMSTAAVRIVLDIVHRAH